MASNTDTLTRLEAPDRVHYATGVMLGAEDFQAEQDYHRGRLARALAYGLGHGTLAGLAVRHQPAREATDGEPAREERLLVTPGLAIDRFGRLIEVPAPRCLRLADWYAAQAAETLAAAHFAADALWEGSPSGVCVDVFVRFLTCPRGKTPAFASDAFDSIDSITAARLRDGYAVELLPRSEAHPPQPRQLWDEITPGDTGSLRDAILAAWHEGSAAAGGHSLAARDELVEGQDPGALFLARLLLPADAGSPPVRRLGEAVAVKNEARSFVVTPAALARWLDIPLSEQLRGESS